MRPVEIGPLVDHVVQRIRLLEPVDGRHLIAIAGPPASGKSTLAESVCNVLNNGGTPCGLVPMDGFHLDNDVLDQRGLRARKGAPETFDAEGFCTLIDRLNREDEVSVPLFDRAKDCVIPDAARVNASQRHVIVEGNYLFLNEPPWAALDRTWSLKVFLAPPLHVLKERLIQRWLSYGLPQAEAEAKAAKNDLPNASLVLENSNQTKAEVLR